MFHSEPNTKRSDVSLPDSFDKTNMNNRVHGKMELLVSSMTAKGYRPVLEDGFLDTIFCDRCDRDTLVRFLADDKSKNDSIETCPCGYYDDVDDDSDKSSEEDYSDFKDYDPDFDVPPGYMDDSPVDMDPDIWREYYTGG